MPERYRRQVAKLAELLESEETRPEAMETLRSLIDRIEVGPPETVRGPCSVTLVGALASVLAFVTKGATTQKCRGLAGHGGSNDGTRLLVAGLCLTIPGNRTRCSLTEEGGSFSPFTAAQTAQEPPAAIRPTIFALMRV